MLVQSSPVSPTVVPVVIVGGGIAGLAAAYELSRQQVPFLILEGGPRLGGVIFSEQIGSFTVVQSG